MREYLCAEAEIVKLGMHDLRRTFGRVAEELTSYAVVKRLLNHRNTTDPTERYAVPDEERIFEALQRIELHMLMTAPKLYNTLLASAKYPHCLRGVRNECCSYTERIIGSLEAIR